MQPPPLPFPCHHCHLQVNSHPQATPIRFNILGALAFWISGLLSQEDLHASRRKPPNLGRPICRVKEQPHHNFLKNPNVKTPRGLRDHLVKRFPISPHFLDPRKWGMREEGPRCCCKLLMGSFLLSKRPLNHWSQVFKEMAVSPLTKKNGETEERMKTPAYLV